MYHGRRYVSLGRPWRAYSRVVYISTDMPSGILPQGWTKWGSTWRNTFYAEAGSTGAGADPSARARWAHTLSASEIESFQPRNFLRGSDNWNPVAEAANLP